MILSFSAKLHYTDTGYGDVVQHGPTDELTIILQLVVQKVTTNGQNFATSQHLDMSRCWALALRCGVFVVELLRARLLVVSVAGVRSRCPYSGVWALALTMLFTTSMIFSFSPLRRTIVPGHLLSHRIRPPRRRRCRTTGDVV